MLPTGRLQLIDDNAVRWLPIAQNDLFAPGFLCFKRAR